jgi:uncharacterized membrane protein
MEDYEDITWYTDILIFPIVFFVVCIVIFKRRINKLDWTANVTLTLYVLAMSVRFVRCFLPSKNRLSPV